MFEPRAEYARDHCRNWLVWSSFAGVGGHGQRIPNRRDISGHDQVRLLQQAVFQSGVQCVHRLTCGKQVPRMACLDRAVNRLAAGLIHVAGLAANLFERAEETDIGRIVHRMSLLVCKTRLMYRGQQ